MTTAYDVPADLLIERVTAEFKAGGKVTPPEWSQFARAGGHTENAPRQKDWWYRRLAAVFRKTYNLGPIGTARLAAEFGGKRGDGAAPHHPRRGGEGRTGGEKGGGGGRGARGDPAAPNHGDPAGAPRPRDPGGAGPPSRRAAAGGPPADPDARGPRAARAGRGGPPP